MSVTHQSDQLLSSLPNYQSEMTSDIASKNLHKIADAIDEDIVEYDMVAKVTIERGESCFSTAGVVGEVSSNTTYK